MTDCICQSHQAAADCCQPFLAREASPANAEQLMRSRYVAYVSGDIDYLVATTVPAQQALLNQAAMAAWSREAEWLGLTVHAHTPHIKPHHAQVEFTARFAENGTAHEHRELSAFVQIDGRWYFIDPTVPLPSMKSPCMCGSGRKFKACCGQFLK